MNRSLIWSAFVAACIGTSYLAMVSAGCYAPPSFAGLKCEDSDDCIGTTCTLGYCGGVLPKPSDAAENTPEIGKESTPEPTNELPPEPTPEAACKDGDTRPCYTGPAGTKDVGNCKAGTERCVGGKWDGQCTDELLPATKETCDGKDEDCDGTVDNGFDVGKDCEVGQGECLQKGKLRCKSDGTGTECDATPAQPATEICDGKDNDCNGQIDEAFPEDGKSCKDPNKQGECANGLSACEKGTLTCPGNTQAIAETCNDKDDDCDGQIDEDFTTKGTSCDFAPNPACKAQGAFVCNAKGDGVECKVKPSVQETCNGLDDNCDGFVDEGCSCNSGDTQPCYNGNVGCASSGGKIICQGICATGTQSCTGGKWGACQNSKTAIKETCNTLDNDCDGTIDQPGMCVAVGIGQRCESSSCMAGLSCVIIPGSIRVCLPPCGFNTNGPSMHDFSQCPTYPNGGVICLEFTKTPDPNDGACTFVCNGGETCPPSLTCISGFCRKP